LPVSVKVRAICQDHYTKREGEILSSEVEPSQEKMTDMELQILGNVGIVDISIEEQENHAHWDPDV